MLPNARLMSVAKRPHAGIGCKRYKRNYLSVLDKILTFFAAQQALNLHRKHQKAILHFLLRGN